MSTDSTIPSSIQDSNQQLLNYKNTTSDPVVVAPVSANFGTSIRIYYNDMIIN